MNRRAFALALLVIAASGAAPAAHAGVIHYRVQPEATEVTFQATSRLMNAEGRFHRVAGDIAVDPADLATARIAFSIETASIDTGIGMRDNHLRSEDFFDTRKFSMATFESVKVEATGTRAVVFGRFTLHGVTRDVAVPVDVTLTDIALVAVGELVLNRRDYGMTYQSSLNPIGNEVRVRFTVRARAA